MAVRRKTSALARWIKSNKFVGTVPEIEDWVTLIDEDYQGSDSPSCYVGGYNLDSDSESTDMGRKYPSIEQQEYGTAVVSKVNGDLISFLGELI